MSYHNLIIIMKTSSCACKAGKRIGKLESAEITKLAFSCAKSAQVDRAFIPFTLNRLALSLGFWRLEPRVDGACDGGGVVLLGDVGAGEVGIV